MNHILILASGSGSNAEAIVKTAQKEKWPVKFTAASDKDSDTAGVYARLKGLGVDTNYITSPLIRPIVPGVFPKPRDFSQLLEFIKRGKYDLVVMAGYMLFLPDDIVQNNKVVNIHPSILPHVYKGSKDAYQDAIDAGDLKTGCTVHIATEDYDNGPIIGQIGFIIPQMILDAKDVNLLRPVGLSFEHALYPECVKSVLLGKNPDMEKVVRVAIYNLTERKLSSGSIIVPSNRIAFDSWNPKVR